MGIHDTNCAARFGVPVRVKGRKLLRGKGGFLILVIAGFLQVGLQAGTPELLERQSPATFSLAPNEARILESA